MKFEIEDLKEAVEGIHEDVPVCDLVNEVSDLLDDFLLNTTRHKSGLTLHEYRVLLEFMNSVRMIRGYASKLTDEGKIQSEQHEYYLTSAIDSLANRVSKAVADLDGLGEAALVENILTRTGGM